MLGSNRVLVICDDLAVSSSLKQRLTSDGDYAVVIADTAKDGMSFYQRQVFDVAIVKFKMPDINGVDLINGLKKIDPDAVIIVFTEEISQSALKEIFRLGAYDFLVKPINFDKLSFLVRKGVHLHALLAANRKLNQSFQEQTGTLQKQNTLLSKRIEESTKNLSRLYEDLRNTYMRTIKVLAQAIDARDHYTHSHSQNVARYSVAIAQELKLPLQEIEILREACELHDLGKIGIGDDILSKPSTLSPQEWDKIKQHPLTGAQILEPLTFLSNVIELVRQHHERYDGAGYPEGRKGEDIVLGARIIGLADAYDAMRSARSYRKIPLDKEAAVAEVKKNSGKQFDPKVVEAFLRVIDKIDPSA